jgi:hypothetical protein
MDERQFDNLARQIATETSRRQMLKAIAGAFGGVFLGRIAVVDPASAQVGCQPGGPCGARGQKCCHGETCANGTCICDSGCQNPYTCTAVGKQNSCAQLFNENTCQCCAPGYVPCDNQCIIHDICGALFLDRSTCLCVASCPAGTVGTSCGAAAQCVPPCPNGQVFDGNTCHCCTPTKGGRCLYL